MAPACEGTRMSRSFDPLATSELITTSYRRYLRSLLPVREPRIAAALDAEISHASLLTKGPLLEATPPYKPGATLGALVDEGVLGRAVRALDSASLPFARPLYLHQEQAIRNIAAERNVIVASGTGSGKTESFLLPILDALAAEHADGQLGPGVRALLLYPMNALANDQLKRLRQALVMAPHITFGRYVGDTREGMREAEETFGLLNPGEPRLPNELLSRAKMRATPPHLLLTNYAMLEYPLLRPADIDLFRPLRYIATSATVGDDPLAVTQFAHRLFDAPFEWIPGESKRQDVVAASRVAMPSGPFWGPLDPLTTPVSRAPKILAPNSFAWPPRMRR